MGSRADGTNPRALGTNNRATGKRKVKLADPVELVVDGQVIGRLLAIELELDELRPAEPEEQLAIGGRGFDPAMEVWSYYAQVMKPRSTGLDPATRKVITDALKVATIDECKRAIDGCAASNFHMGQNDRRRKYNRITHILKGKQGRRTTREQIDLFLDLLERERGKGASSGFTSVDHAKVARAKRDVRDGIEFPSDALVVEQADQARAWLESQGFRVEYEDGGVGVRFVEPTAA